MDRGSAAVEIGRAASADIDGILALQAAEQPERGGALSVNFPHAKIAAMIAELPCVVARSVTHQGGRVVGFLLTSSVARAHEAPVLRAMLAAAGETAAGTYVYGPICVAADVRGRGIAGAMFRELVRVLPGQDGILFIRADNAPPLRAHAKMGMRIAGHFSHKGAGHVVLAYSG